MSRRTRTTQSSRKGVALLLVLGIIMAITLLSLGFIARCDMELASGQNMAVRAQMDQVAMSGLEHARGLLLNPQEADGEFWTGDTELQLAPDSNDFYDVTVEADPSDECAFDVTCEAYRLRGGERLGASRLAAVVRLDPAIGIWCKSGFSVRENWGVTGDVYSVSTLTNLGARSAVNGDVFANALYGDIVGRYRSAASLTTPSWPPVTLSYSHPDYTTSYIGPGTVSGTYDSPAIWRCDGDLILEGSVVINGMLLVKGNLTIEGSGARLTAAKNLAVVYVTGSLIFRGVTDLRIDGLIAVDRHVLVGRDSTDIQVRGGLFAKGGIVETAIDSSGQRADCVLKNGVTWIDAGVVGGALVFDGQQAYLKSSDNQTSLQIPGDYTLSVWMNAGSSQKAYAGVISKTDTSGSSNHWALQFDYLGAELIVSHGADSRYTGITRAHVAGAWHHVAVVRQGTTMTYYLDGAWVDSDTLSTAPASGAGHLNIACDYTGWSTRVYKGLLDDVRVYNRALLPAEVSAPPDDASLIGHWTFDESGSELNVIASPTKAAISTWASGTREDWSPAGSAFFRSIDSW